MKVIPFYVATVYQKQFGLAVPRPVSVIILDATNGETKEYSLSEVPEWVDRVYPAEETIEQINYNGKYKDGFLECHDFQEKRDPDYQGL